MQGPQVDMRIEILWSSQWRNLVVIANMAPLGDENVPLNGAHGIRAPFTGSNLCKYGCKI